MNDWKRKSFAVAAVVLLSAPSALGVQRALSVTRGDIAGWMAAIGIELAYLSLAVLILRGDLQRYARRIALTAVCTAILLNVVADYSARTPDGLANAETFLVRFDWLHLALSVIESAPLAGLAYTIATLLHRLTEEEPTPPPVINPPHPVVEEKTFQCPRCGRALSSSHYGAAKRFGYCKDCKEQT